MISILVFKDFALLNWFCCRCFACHRCQNESLGGEMTIDIYYSKKKRKSNSKSRGFQSMNHGSWNQKICFWYSITEKLVCCVLSYIFCFTKVRLLNVRIRLGLVNCFIWFPAFGKCGECQKFPKLKLKRNQKKQTEEIKHATMIWKSNRKWTWMCESYFLVIIRITWRSLLYPLRTRCEIDSWLELELGWTTLWCVTIKENQKVLQCQQTISCLLPKYQNISFECWGFKVLHVFVNRYEHESSLE